MALQLRALNAFAEDKGLIPATHMAAHNRAQLLPENLILSFDFGSLLHICGEDTLTQAYEYTHNII